MLGLLIKDMKLMLIEKKYFSLILLIAIMLAFTVTDMAFIITYVTIIFSSYTVTTISYDEANNGNAFLMTLPFDRSIYVKEKYLFAIIIISIIFISTTLITAIYQNFTIQNFNTLEWILSCTLVLPIVFLMLSFMIPLHLKFGGEKARSILLTSIGIIFVGGFLIVKFIEIININLTTLMSVLNSYFSDDFIISIYVFLISVIVMIVSYFISQHIIKHKEY